MPQQCRSALAFFCVALCSQFSQAGDFKRELKIKTDLQDAPVIVTLEGSVTP